MSTAIAICALSALFSQTPNVSSGTFDSSRGTTAGSTPKDTAKPAVAPKPGGKTAADSIQFPGRATRPLCGPVPGRIFRWNPKLGPLHLSGTVVIGPGQKAILAAGTSVIAESGRACQDSADTDDGTTLLVAVGGSLMVQGTPSRPVVFQPPPEARGLSWGGIRILGASEGDVDLAWTQLHRARTGATFATGTGEMRHASIEDCGIGIAVLSGAAPRILHCAIGRSAVADVVSERSAPLFRSCLFLDGRGDALRFQGVGLARVENSCFWGHRGTVVVRGPTGMGGWKSDTVPDRFGNWHRDPILRDSPSDREITDRKRREFAAAPWWKRERAPETPPGSGPWALSPYSPLVGMGERGLCELPSGTRCDIGLWSGP